MLQSPDVQFVQIRVVLGFFWLLTVRQILLLHYKIYSFYYSSICYTRTEQQFPNKCDALLTKLSLHQFFRKIETSNNSFKSLNLKLKKP